MAPSPKTADRTPRRDGKQDQRVKTLSHREIWSLIWQTYRAVMPRVLLFCLLLLLFTFFVTEVLF